MTPEAKVRNPVVAWAKRCGILHRRMHMGRGASSGWPDDVFIRGGVHVWIEFKRLGKTPTLLQRRRHDELRLAGARVYWFDNADDAMSVLRMVYAIPSLRYGK